MKSYKKDEIGRLGDTGIYTVTGKNYQDTLVNIVDLASKLTLIK